MKPVWPGLVLVCSLCILNACGGANGAATPQPVATHFSITSQTSVAVGTAFKITVTALDASNNTVSTYSGTVHFTSSDAQAFLPSATTLTSGTGTFPVTLMTIGNQTVSATDSSKASITGTSKAITVIDAATHFSVTAPTNVTTGIPFNFTVTALDALNNAVPTYAGTVHFTSTDAQVSLPADSTLTNGSGSFPATLATLGSQTITATDSATASLTGTSSAITVGTAAPTHFSVAVPGSGGVTSGRAFNFTVSALDTGDNVAPTYSGTIHFTSTDSQASLPANGSLMNGTGSFSATLNTVGSQTITATDTGTASITGTSSPIDVSKLVITSGNPPNGTVGRNYGPLNDCIPQGFALSASGGFRNFETWTASSLPPGLKIGVFSPSPANPDCRLGPATWIIYGTPSQAGTFNNVVVTVHLGAASASATYTITISAASASVANSIAQDADVQHHHYKLIDIGTFGGPQSFFDDLHLGDNYGFNTIFYGFSQVLNGKGMLVGFADTATSDPYASDPRFCYVPDCFVNHAFLWQNGIKTDLGVLPGGASSAAFWINSNGLIAGDSQNGELDPVIPGVPELRAVIWKNGTIRDLGTLGGSSSFSQSVNDRGQVTGLALNTIPDPFSFYYQFLYCIPFQICPAGATETRAFIWNEKDGIEDIGTLGGQDAFPGLINQHGQIAGFSYTDSTPQPTTGFPTLHPFLWEKGKGMKDLGSLGGTSTASVNGLNERGEVVGGSLLAGDLINHPFLWDGKRLIDLVAPPFGGTADGESAWINEEGEVVGIAGIPSPCPGSSPPREAAHAFLWRHGVMTDLGGLQENSISQAAFINSRSQIVGDSAPCDFSSSTAFLWENGSIVDLNTLVPAGSPFYLFTSSFIDDRGEIAAFGTLPSGDTHAVLLIPCDENHTDIEGCDYSMVDASTAPAVPAAIHEAPEHMRPNTMWRRNRSFRFRGLSSSN